MALPSSVILVCAGADVGRAAAHGHPLLDLCLGVTARGTLGRLQATAAETNSFLGIRDLPTSISSVNVKAFVDDLIYVLRQHGARGVFADFESHSTACRELCTALDDALYQQSIPFFVPAVRGEDTTHAFLVVETAVSGGSLSDMIADLQYKYGRERIAALLRPVSADFSLPSSTPDGMHLTLEARLALRERTAAQVFFSKELCAKYFTYMDEDMRGHFVLFDDESTLLDKIEQLTAQGVRHFFALYPDVKNML